MVQSVEDQIAQNENAISAVETRGQRMTVKDREIWRADLKALDDRAERLERKAARQKNGGVRVSRIVPL